MRPMKFFRALCTVTLLGGALLAATPGDPPLADAAMRGDLDAVKRLLREGADVNAPHGDGMTALHWAAEQGNLEMVKTLLYAGANVDALTRIGNYTPLLLAAQAGQASVMKPLLDAGSDVNAATTTGGSLPIHFAAASGNTDAISVLLDAGADVNAREPLREQTPLVFAASYNRLEAVNLLIERGADVNLQTLMEDTSIAGAQRSLARSRRSQVLASIRDPDEARKVGYSPEEIQLAVRAGRKEVPPPGAEAEEEEPQDMDEFRFGRVGGYGGLTALLHAAREGHREIAAALLDAGADLEQVGTGENFTPLMMAIVNGHFDLAMDFLDRGANPNYASASGDTALYAVLDAQWAPKSTGRPRQRAYEQQETSYLELMEKLLLLGADPNARLTGQPPYESRAYLSVNVTGATPFWRAAYGTDVAAMKLLVRNGADPSLATLNRGRSRGGGGRFGARGRRGANPDPQGGNAQPATGQGPNQQGAAQDPQIAQGTRGRAGRGAGGPQAEERPEPRVDPSGLPPVPDDGPGVYPIHAASGVGYGQGFAGNSHRHVPDGWLPAIRYLIDEIGADVNARDLNGYTALHHAASRGDNELMMFLMERGADATVVSRRGETIADMANQPSSRLTIFPETIELAIRLGSKLTPKDR